MASGERSERPSGVCNSGGCWLVEFLNDDDFEIRKRRSILHDRLLLSRMGLSVLCARVKLVTNDVDAVGGEVSAVLVCNGVFAFILCWPISIMGLKENIT